MSSIPADVLVDVTPGVVSAGGTGVNGVGLVLTHNTRIPIGTVEDFADPDGVAAFFGPSDPLVTTADDYFAGFVGATVLPSTLLMAQYNPSTVAAYLRGGNVSGLSLSQLQAISGTLAISVDGFNRSASINLSSATSPTNAATIIQGDLNGVTLTEASVTASIAPESATITGSIAGTVLTVTATNAFLPIGTTITGTGVAANTVITGQLSGTLGGIGTYAVTPSQVVASKSLTGAYGLMTVTVVGSGTLAVGQTLSGSGVTVGTLITQLGSGTGNTGTYYVNDSQTVGSEAVTASATAITVIYDSVSNGFVFTSGNTGAASTIAFPTTGTVATDLLLTSATGALLSQGAAPATPATYMNALAAQNMEWANFMTHFDPDGGGGNTQKQAFANWKDTYRGGNKVGYFCWDPDASPAASSDAPNCLGQILEAEEDSGTLLIWEGGNATNVDSGLCAFALGLAASINYNGTPGRTNFAYRRGATQVGNVTDVNTATNLKDNGYCFYGVYGSATATFTWFQNGQITGPFAWADSYQTQLWLNSLFQNALLVLFENALSVPFTVGGIALIEQTLQSIIQQAAAFGAFAPNTLTSAQIALVNAAAGANIAPALQAQGYFLQIQLPSQAVQAARGPWPMTFWYIDQNSVQSIDLASLLVQ